MKKSQGELFGIALVFVIIIFGLIFYSKFKTIKGDDSTLDAKYQNLEKLVASSLSTTINMGTDCYVERYSNTVGDLIKFCMMKTYSGSNAEISCKHIGLKNACTYSIKLINMTLFRFFNSTEYFTIPFFIKFKTPQSYNSYYNELNFSNFYYFENGNLSLNTIKKYGYLNKIEKKLVFPTAQGPLEIYLSVYLKSLNR